MVEIPEEPREMLDTTKEVEMTETGDEKLRALIRLIPPARALKRDLEKSINLELYSGAGNLAVKSFQGLQTSVAKIADDPYVDSLSLVVAENATDKEQVSQVLLAVGQLVGYLEGQTGLVGMGGSKEAQHIQTAPWIQLMNVKGVSSEAIEKAMAPGGAKDQEEKEEKE